VDVPDADAVPSSSREPAASAPHGIATTRAEPAALHEPPRSTSATAAGVARIELARAAKPQPTFTRDAGPADPPTSPLTNLLSPLSAGEPPAAWEDNEGARSPLPPSFEPPLAPGRPIGAVRDGSPPPAARDRTNPKERRSAASPGTRHVHVTIGRVEVRAVPAGSAPRQPSPERRPVALSLEDYLRKRGEP
jgi:hypothetical protein